MTSVYKCSTKIYVSLDFFFLKCDGIIKTNHYFIELHKRKKTKNKTKILHCVHILILETLKFEKQHMVNT